MTEPATSRRRRQFDWFFRHATVAGIEPVTARMHCITLHGSGVRGLSYRPGQQVRVNVKDLTSAAVALRGFRDARRSYSIWRYDPAGELDLCVLDHAGDGPGAQWARTLAPGDSVSFSGPEGDFVVRDDAMPAVFAAEETGAVAITAMLRALPASATVTGVLEAATVADELPQSGPHRLSWVHRGATSAASSACLVDAVRALDLPGEAGTAYLAGEARTCQLVRAYLVRERGWPRRSVHVKAFWSPGKRGLE